MLVAQTIYRRGKGAQTHRAAAAAANCKGRLEFRKCLHGLPSRVELRVELRESGGKCELHTHTTHNQHGCSAPLSLLPLFVPSIVFNDCATRGCFCCAPAKFATVSCAHNYVAAQKCCLPTGAHTKHTLTNWLAAAHQCAVVVAVVVPAPSVSGTR